MDYFEKLEALYLSSPFHVSNIAFWKLVDFAKKGHIHHVEKKGYEHLYIEHENRLLFYYSWKEVEGEFVENNEEVLFTKKDLMAYDMAILNSTQYGLLSFKHPNVKKSHPFKYIGNDIGLRGNLEADYEVISFDFDKDYSEAANIINRSYTWANYTADTIKAITETPAFSPDLWIWLVEKKSQKKAALGIGDFYEPIQEGTLDWIQVDPKFSKKGLGQLLVKSLINKILLKNGHIRVTGIADDFYRKCGLRSDETWYILDTKGNCIE